MAIVINKADATVTVSGYTGVYDAAAHGATGTCHRRRCGGATSAAASTSAPRFTNVPGGTAHWTFTGGTNYNDQSGDVAIVINKADATVSVSGYTGDLRRQRRTAPPARATGVGGSQTWQRPQSRRHASPTSPAAPPTGPSPAAPTTTTRAATSPSSSTRPTPRVTVSGYTGTYDGSGARRHRHGHGRRRRQALAAA